MQSAKNTIRVRALKQRDDYTESLDEKTKKKLVLRICDHFLASVPLSKNALIAGYWPIGSELDSRGLMDQLWGRGHRICLPIAKGPGADLIFRIWKPGDTLKPGHYDIPEPLSTAEIVDPDVLIIPLVSFDRRGHRLGYGAGHYDRTIAQMRKRKKILAVGIALERQHVNELPMAKYDQALDFVVTEERACRFS